MYLHNTLGRGLLDFATPLLTEIEKTFDPAFVEEDGDYVFEVEMPGFSKEDVKINILSALNFVDRERLIPSSNCGMAPLSQEIDTTKIKALGAGTELVNNSN